MFHVDRAVLMFATETPATVVYSTWRNIAYDLNIYRYENLEYGRAVSIYEWITNDRQRISMKRVIVGDDNGKWEN